MTTVKGIKSASTVAALKAERERDMAQAMRDYEDESRARQANMARLRALRLAKERTELNTPAAPRSGKKKAATSAKKKVATSAKKKAATQTGRESRATS